MLHESGSNPIYQKKKIKQKPGSYVDRLLIIVEMQLKSIKSPLFCELTNRLI